MSASDGGPAKAVEFLDERESNAQHEAISAVFLGPRAENFNKFQEFITMVIEGHRDLRLSYQPNDPVQITPAIQASAAYGNRMNDIHDGLVAIQQEFQNDSVPFWSPRYNGHMLSDTSMPATLGYLSTMLWNPNNVTGEASRVSADIETVVGLQLCSMLGFDTTQDPKPWGHITSGGTVANLESLWAARNLKFYPLSFRSAIDDEAELVPVQETFQIETCMGSQKLFKDLSVWEMLNLKPQTILEIGERVEAEYNISQAHLTEIMEPYNVQNAGKGEIEKRYGIELPMKFLVCSTRHYSWPKSADITGIGAANMINVPVDNSGRLRPDKLREQLDGLLADGKAVYSVVAIAGSTEEGAVDPVQDVINLRTEYQAKGMSFVVHVDAAWGGYFRNMVPPLGVPFDGNPDYVGSLPLRTEVEDNLRAIQYADSVTVDPHKSGYIPYPAGSLCYRDGRVRFLVTWTGPYLASSAGIGAFGVEGSKPGAAGVAVFMSHHVIGLDLQGYGALLSSAIFTCSRMSCYWATMESSNFVVVPFNMLTSENQDTVQRYASTPEVIDQRNQLSALIPMSNWDIQGDPAALQLLQGIGSDLIINSFACNFKVSDDEWNTDVEEANMYNKRIADLLTVSADPESQRPISDQLFFISSTTFEGGQYLECATSFKTRLGLTGDTDLFLLRSVVMSPFVTTQGLLTELMEVFRNVAEEQAQISLKRNDKNRRVTHTFLVHPTESKLYLVHQHMFYIPTHREQLIITAEITSHYKESYGIARAASKGHLLFLTTTSEVTLSEILEKGSFCGTLSMHKGSKEYKWDVDVTNIKIIKRRPLYSRARDTKYPPFIPFYLYGTPDALNIDHMLLCAPSIHISAENIKTKLDKELTASDLEKGLILCVRDLRETWMKPDEYKILFNQQRTFQITVHRDPKEACAEGPGLADVDLDKPLAKGTMTLKGSIFISDTVNQNPYEKQDKDGMPVLKPFHTPGVVEIARKAPLLCKKDMWNKLGYADWVKD